MDLWNNSLYKYSMMMAEVQCHYFFERPTTTLYVFIPEQKQGIKKLNKEHKLEMFGGWCLNFFF